jgi:hypothetical protein
MSKKSIVLLKMRNGKFGRKIHFPFWKIVVADLSSVKLEIQNEKEMGVGPNLSAYVLFTFSLIIRISNKRKTRSSFASEHEYFEILLTYTD